MHFKEFLEQYPSEQAILTIADSIVLQIQEGKDASIFLLNACYAGYASFLAQIITESKKINIDYCKTKVHGATLLSKTIGFILESIGDLENVDRTRNGDRAACIKILLENEANPNCTHESELPFILKIKNKILSLPNKDERIFLNSIISDLKRHHAIEFTELSLTDFLTKNEDFFFNHQSTLSSEDEALFKKTISKGIYLYPPCKLGEGLIKKGYSRAFCQLLSEKPEIAIQDSFIFLLENTTLLSYAISSFKQTSLFKFGLTRETLAGLQTTLTRAFNQIKIINELINHGASLKILTCENTVFACIQQKKQSLVLQLMASIINFQKILRSSGIPIETKIRKQIQELILKAKATIDLMMTTDPTCHQEEHSEYDIALFRQKFQNDSQLLRNLDDETYHLGPIMLASLCIENNFTTSLDALLHSYESVLSADSILGSSSLLEIGLNYCCTLANAEPFNLLSFESALINLKTLSKFTTRLLPSTLIRPLLSSKHILLKKQPFYTCDLLDELIQTLSQEKTEIWHETGIDFSSLSDFEEKFPTSVELCSNMNSIILNYNLKKVIYFASLKGFKDFIEEIILISPSLINAINKIQEKTLHELTSYFLLEGLSNSTLRQEDIHQFLQTIELLLTHSDPLDAARQKRILAKFYEYQRKSPKDSITCNVAIFLEKFYKNSGSENTFEHEMSLEIFQEKYPSDYECLESYYYLSYLLGPSKFLSYCVQSDYIETIQRIAELEGQNHDKLTITIDPILIESAADTNTLIEENNIVVSEKKISILQTVLKMKAPAISDNGFIEVLVNLAGIYQKHPTGPTLETIQLLIKKHNESIKVFSDNLLTNPEVTENGLNPSSLEQAFLITIKNNDPDKFRSLLSMVPAQLLLTPLTQDSGILRNLYAHLFELAISNPAEAFNTSPWLSILEETLRLITSSETRSKTINLILKNLELAFCYLEKPTYKNNLYQLKEITTRYASEVEGTDRFITERYSFLVNLLKEKNQELISLVLNESLYFNRVLGLLFIDLSNNIYDAPIEDLRLLNPTQCLLNYQKMHFCSFITELESISFLNHCGFNLFINEDDVFKLLPIHYLYDHPAMIEAIQGEDSAFDLIKISEPYSHPLKTCIHHQKTESLHFLLEAYGAPRQADFQPLELILNTIPDFKSLEMVNIYIATLKKFGFNLMDCSNERGGPVHWAVNSNVTDPLLKEAIILLNELQMNKEVEDNEGLNSCQKYFGHTYDLIIGFLANDDINSLWETMISSLKKGELPTKKRRTLTLSDGSSASVPANSTSSKYSL